MAIYIPTLMEPLPLRLGGTVQQWDTYIELQKASIAYTIAYNDAIGVFALFSRKKQAKLGQARAVYEDAKKNYLAILGLA